MNGSFASASAYEVLGVSPSSTHDELRRAYRQRLRESHPDTGGTPEAFRAVQQAWEHVGTPAGRAAYDAGAGGGARGAAPDAQGSSFAGAGRASAGHPSTSTSPRARSYGHPGGEEREHYLTLMREWVGRGVELKDPYDPALVRSAPREIRRWLAKAMAEEETARIVSTLGMGFTVWNNVKVAKTGSNIDHVVLGPAGLFAVQSYDWGSPVRVSKSELEGEAIGDDEPLRSLGANARALGRSLGVRFTAIVVVVPDEDLDAAFERVERGRQAGAVVIRRSVLPQLLRSGLGDTDAVNIDRIFELRSRLQSAVQFV